MTPPGVNFPTRECKIYASTPAASRALGPRSARPLRGIGCSRQSHPRKASTDAQSVGSRREASVPVTDHLAVEPHRALCDEAARLGVRRRSEARCAGDRAVPSLRRDPRRVRSRVHCPAPLCAGSLAGTAPRPAPPRLGRGTARQSGRPTRASARVDPPAPPRTSPAAASRSPHRPKPRSPRYSSISVSEMLMRRPYISSGASVMPTVLPRLLDIFSRPSIPTRSGSVITTCGGCP